MHSCRLALRFQWQYLQVYFLPSFLPYFLQAADHRWCSGSLILTQYGLKKATEVNDLAGIDECPYRNTVKDT
jgi:hypothetical protein